MTADPDRPPMFRLLDPHGVEIAKGSMSAVSELILDSKSRKAAEALLRDTADTIDARGKLVLPGLIDIHTHTARDKNDAHLCLADGVTAMVDAGSRGADLIGEAVAVAKASPNQLRLLINVSRKGSLPVMTLDLADVPLGRAAIARHRDMIVGIKARMERKAWGGPDAISRRLRMPRRWPKPSICR
jgi:dihydroorotase